MNLLLLAPDAVDSHGVARLSGRRADHLKRVLGIQCGSNVRAGVLGRGTGNATVLAVEEHSVVLQVKLTRGLQPRSIEVVVALPRPKVIPRLLSSLAALAVARIDLVNAWKVDKGYFGSPKLVPEFMREEMWLGAEQGGHASLPQLEVHQLFVPFVRETLRARLEAHPTLAFVCHPRATQFLHEAWLEASEGPRAKTGPEPDHQRPPRICLAIGPEGGWTELELRSFDDSGFARTRIVEGVLRVEAATVAAVAQLELLAQISPPICRPRSKQITPAP